MQDNRFISAAVGLFVILALAATAFLGLRSTDMGGFHASNTYTVYGMFTDVSGLNKNAAVTSAGVQIGKVKAITLDPTTMQARVDLEISSEYNNFGNDSSAEVLTAGLLGEKYIGLTEGGGIATLEDGDQIAYTGSSMVIERLIQQFVSDMSTK